MSIRATLWAAGRPQQRQACTPAPGVSAALSCCSAPPAPEQEQWDTNNSPSANGANGRDGSGRIAKGDPGGPGNPHARRVSELRSVLLGKISDQDIVQIVDTLLSKEGDLPAIREVLDRALGKSTQQIQATWGLMNATNPRQTSTWPSRLLVCASRWKSGRSVRLARRRLVHRRVERRRRRRVHRPERRALRRRLPADDLSPMKLHGPHYRDDGGEWNRRSRMNRRRRHWTRRRRQWTGRSRLSAQLTPDAFLRMTLARV
jgi:hypothetical protein